MLLLKVTSNKNTGSILVSNETTTMFDICCTWSINYIVSDFHAASTLTTSHTYSLPYILLLFTLF